jgi:hypothetical protein
MSKEIKYFDISSLQYAVQSKINIQPLCNAVTVKNNGNIICLLDSEPILPGESKSFGGNENEVFSGRHEISFTTVGMTVVPPVEIPSAWVTQKFYISNPVGAKVNLP